MDERGIGGTYMIQQQFIHMFRVIQSAEKTVDNGPPASSVFRRPYYSQCGEYWKRIKPSVIEAEARVDSYPPDGYFQIKELPINKKPPAVYVPAKAVIRIGGRRPRTASAGQPQQQKQHRSSCGETTVGGLLTSRGKELLPPESILHRVELSSTTRDLIKAKAPEKLIDYATSIDTRRYQLDLELAQLSRRREAHQQSPLHGVHDVATAAVGLLSNPASSKNFGLAGSVDGKGLLQDNKDHRQRLVPRPPTHDGVSDPLADLHNSPLRYVGSIDTNVTGSEIGDVPKSLASAAGNSAPRRLHSVRFLKDDAGPQIAAEIFAVSAPKRLKSFKRGGSNGGIVSGGGAGNQISHMPSTSPPLSQHQPEAVVHDAHAAAAHDVVSYALQSSVPSWKSTPPSGSNAAPHPAKLATTGSASLFTQCESVVCNDEPPQCVPLMNPSSSSVLPPAVVGIIRPYQLGDTADDEF